MDFFSRLFSALFGSTAATPVATVATKTTPTFSQSTVMQAESNLAASGTLSRAQVEAIAKRITQTYFPFVDWRMLVTMCAIESSFQPSAQRKEYNARGEVRDISYGLMQVLISTAAWIYKDLGRRSYGAASVANLTKPETSIYYGAAYVNWLRTWKGARRSEEWIVRAYNGGPGWASSATAQSMTLNHWTKYRKQKAAFYG